MTIKIDNKTVAKTTQERDRVWNQTFQILCAHSPTTTITITPVNVTAEGHVEDLMERNGHFPDTEALIKGKRSKVLAPTITT